MTSWTADAAFEEVVPATAQAKAKPGLCCTIQTPTTRGARFRFSIAREVLAAEGYDAGDRFKVLVTETVAAFYIRLVKDSGGRAQLTVPPLHSKTPQKANRLLLAVSGVPDVGLKPSKSFEPTSWRIDRSRLDIRFDKAAVPPVTPFKGGAPLGDRRYKDAPLTPGQKVAADLARKWAESGAGPDEIVQRLSAEQNFCCEAGWVIKQIAESVAS